jgi:hypothetical protein
MNTSDSSSSEVYTTAYRSTVLLGHSAVQLAWLRDRIWQYKCPHLLTCVSSVLHNSHCYDNSHLLEVAGPLACEGLQCALAPLKHQHRGGVGGVAGVAHLKHRHKLAGGACGSTKSTSTSPGICSYFQGLKL